MNPEDLQPASYRGAVFFVSSHTVSGGRKDAKKEFVNSDLQLVEDLGLRQPVFTISGVVAARRDNSGNVIQSYLEVRRELIAALEKGGTGILVHPFFGRVEDVVCRTFSLTEDMTRLGDSPITITFEISNTTGVPRPLTNVLNQIVEGKDLTVAAVKADDRFDVTPGFAGNFVDAVAKVNEVADALDEATSPAAALAGEIDAFSSELAQLSDNVTNLVDNPTTLKDSITSLFETINGLYSTPEATLDAFERLFDFGDDDSSFALDTPGRVERQQNRSGLNGTVRSLALAYAYLNASQVDLKNELEIDDVALTLEAQYQAVVDSGDADSGVVEELTKLRISVTRFFDDQRLVKPQIITVRTNATSTRLLAYQYYGSSSQGRDLAVLNGLRDSAFVEGEVQILTA